MNRGHDISPGTKPGFGRWRIIISAENKKSGHLTYSDKKSKTTTMREWLRHLDK